MGWDGIFGGSMMWGWVLILRQDEPTCYPAIQHASRTLRRGGAPTARSLRSWR